MLNRGFGFGWWIGRRRVRWTEREEGAVFATYFIFFVELPGGEVMIRFMSIDRERGEEGRGVGWR